MEVKIKSEIGSIRWELPSWFTKQLKGKKDANTALKVVSKEIIGSVCGTVLALLVVGNIIGEEKAKKYFSKLQKALYDISDSSCKNITKYLNKKK